MTDDQPSTMTRLWLMTGSIPMGPYDPVQVHTKLSEGEITWETLACPVGGRTWLPLVQTPGFGPSVAPPVPAQPEPSSSSVEPSSASAQAVTPIGAVRAMPEQRPARTWNPATIAWLGVPFTPPWAGVMAALNGKRLGSPSPAWIPLAIGFGSVAADVLISLVVDSFFVSVLLYLGALGLLWRMVLRHQDELIAVRSGAGPGTTAGWGWPAAAGAPLALVAFFGFVVAPLLPLEPRKVCEKFNAASSAKAAAKYTTLNLLPALDALYAQKDRGEPYDFELTDEAEGPPELGGYLVGFRFASVEAGRPVQMEGAYHLVNFDGDWKIEDLYFTTLDRQPLERRVKLSTDYVFLFQQPTRAVIAPSGSGTGDRTQAPWYTNPAVQERIARGAGHSLMNWEHGGGGKAFGKVLLGLLAAIAAGISSLWRKSRTNTPSETDGMRP